MKKINLIALYKLYVLRQRHSLSTFIDEETITAGFGKLDNLGLFEYPLPNWWIKWTYGAMTWEKSEIYKN